MQDKTKSARTLWYCVHDRNMRQLYLGTDEAAAQAAVANGGVIRTAPAMGDAMRLAALAYGAPRKRFDDERTRFTGRGDRAAEVPRDGGASR